MDILKEISNLTPFLGIEDEDFLRLTMEEIEQLPRYKEMTALMPMQGLFIKKLKECSQMAQKNGEL